MQTTPAKNLWVKSAWVDLSFFSFGWAVALVAFLLMDQTELKHQSRNILIVSILMVSFLHRHLTFPLVYGDPEQFRLRKKTYLTLPVLFLAVTLFAIFFVRPPAVQSQTVTSKLQVNKGATQEFRFYERGKKPEKVQVRFSGREKTPEAVAATFNRDLQGNVQVRAEQGKLNFKFLDPKPNSRFYMGNPKGDRALKKKLGLEEISGKSFYSSRPLLFFLIVVSIIWNVYHTLMQKIGILRVYARKANYGIPWVDKTLVFSWLVFVILALGKSEAVRKQASALSGAGRLISTFLEYLSPFLPYLTLAVLLFSVWVTLLYIREEYRHREFFHWPKNLFVLSILLLYAGFSYDLLVGYAVFGFSHAIEYLAFVYVYAGKKYQDRPARSSLMARLVRHQAPAMAIYCIAMISIFVIWRFNAATILGLYILGSSFLHFLYDGWIWKVRDPKVGKPLGIDYGARPELQGASLG